MIEEKVLIDKETLKAIAVDTRLNIMKLLAKKKYTLTDLSDMLGLGNSTVKEHLDHLAKAGLVEKEETDRKWKFYSITLKGRRLVEPREIKVLFTFALTTMGAIASAIWFATKVNLIDKAPLFAAEAAPERLMVAAPMVEESAAAAREIAYDTAQEKIVAAAQEQTATAAQTIGINPWIVLGIMISFMAVSAFLLGYYLKKKTIIIQKKE